MMISFKIPVMVAFSMLQVCFISNSRDYMWLHLPATLPPAEIGVDPLVPAVHG
jgi:hypothetical protein